MIWFKDVVTRIEKLSRAIFVQKMDERKSIKQVFDMDLDDNAVRGMFHDQIDKVLEKGQVKNARNRLACVKNLKTIDKAKTVCKNRSKCKQIISAYPL
jgi:hypothetical protein